MDANPFAALSLIVAPAILTNASSVLVLSTSNRLARAVDRARELSKQLEATTDFQSDRALRRMHELKLSEQRTLLLLRGIRSFYLALGGFASAALVSLLGAVLVPTELAIVVLPLEVLAVLIGVLAVGSLVFGSVRLLQETKIAVEIVSARVATVQARAEL
ncbi:MAG: DUF2721 domain-containing protein [Planctomycetaceae bacterium]|nr:DUF2721 domain-containing protein [Planctomycetaceae bacterium]